MPSDEPLPRTVHDSNSRSYFLPGHTASRKNAAARERNCEKNNVRGQRKKAGPAARPAFKRAECQPETAHWRGQPHSPALAADLLRSMGVRWLQRCYSSSRLLRFPSHRRRMQVTPSPAEATAKDSAHVWGRRQRHSARRPSLQSRDKEYTRTTYCLHPKATCANESPPPNSS
ncbi:hypothetical protein HPB51_002420 [Rhipicephalus microplus]|uniref:Uncharacterized protein n=1 Tax=Rhipicephalus microplus TaxID=6941 RepID=A0A9J6DSQ8_RHIMP|nr:hypothetical protein HPB51_002420 [Rhipicephalus microplus]